MFFQTAKHPGINSGLDLIAMGLADNLNIDPESHRDYTRNYMLIAYLKGKAVAYWQPDYIREGGLEAAGWYCSSKHMLILVDLFWHTKGTT